jgi:hypothetical protein
MLQVGGATATNQPNNQPTNQPTNPVLSWNMHSLTLSCKLLKQLNLFCEDEGQKLLVIMKQ